MTVEAELLKPQRGDVIVFKGDYPPDWLQDNKLVEKWKDLELLYVLLREDASIECLDEEGMRRHGWIRAPAIGEEEE